MTLLGGFLIHAVLVFSLKTYLAGWIDEPVLVATQIANPAIPMLLVAILGLGRRQSVGTARD